MPRLPRFRDLASRAGYGLLERALWLHLAAQRPETPAWARSVIYGALGYLVLPADAVPDVLPGGYADDLGVLAGALATVAAFVTDEVKAEADRVLRTWFGR